MHLDEEWMKANGGVVTRRQLRRWGNTETQLRAAMRSGALSRVRNGWYSTPTADAQAVAAVRAGAALSCVTVLRRNGVWTPGSGLHLRPGHHDNFRRPPGAKVCPCPGVTRTPPGAIDNVPTALMCASRCCAGEDFLILLDSVVNLELMTRSEVEALFVKAPGHVKAVVAQMDSAESGTETMVRMRLRKHRVKLRPQVQIGTIGRVDFLIGSSLVIEVDSKAHHTDLLAYESDRERDRKLRTLGYTVIRLTYDQVVNKWAEVEQDLLRVIASGVHRKRVTKAP